MIQGNDKASISCFKDAPEYGLNDAERLNVAGLALHAQNRLDDAVFCFRQALKQRRDFPEALNHLGIVLIDQGKSAEAAECFQRALRAKADYKDAHYNLGVLLMKQGRLEESTVCFERALRLDPDFLEAHNNLGFVFTKLGSLENAIQHYLEALRVDSRFADAFNGLGNALKAQGKIKKALEMFSKALELRPDFVEAHSNFLLSLNYDPNIQPADVFREHRWWARKHAGESAPSICSDSLCPNSPRKLRIGYVSPDFRSHSVAFFIGPVLSAHDRSCFEIICYSDVQRPDETTRILKSLVHSWRDTWGLSHEQVAKMVRDDRIDILVDLAGHTANNRLLLFAKRAAPIQVTYLGYPNTTGLWSMDYRLTDSWADPPHQTEHLHTEQLFRLAKGFLCYAAPERAPLVNEAPCIGRGRITFGCFNNHAKITPVMVMLWSRILHAVPDSRIILKSKALSDEGVRQGLRAMFVRNGISPDRIESHGHTASLLEHLNLYNTVDIGLDTFPYNGTTTTCEAMWMGVPVVTLAGETHASRVGVSLLSRAGLPFAIAASPQEYVEKTVGLAWKPERVQSLRANLRQTMSRSSLMDSNGFIHCLEMAYRDMYQMLCCRKRPGSRFSEKVQYRETINGDSP